jgi:hypothetical protein
MVNPNGCGGSLPLAIKTVLSAKEIQSNHGEKTVLFAKKAITGFAVFGALAVPGIAFAAVSSAGPGGCTGVACYDANPGRPHAVEVGAQAGSGAGSGGFGAFTGAGNNFAGGANGFETGLANSAIAGNRQGNLP